MRGGPQQFRGRSGPALLFVSERLGDRPELRVGAGVAVDLPRNLAQPRDRLAEVAEAVQLDGLLAGPGGEEGGDSSVDRAVAGLGIVGPLVGVLPADRDGAEPARAPSRSVAPTRTPISDPISP